MLPFRQAVKLPIAIGWRTSLDRCSRGSLVLEGDIEPLSVLFGFGGSRDLQKYNSTKNYLSIRKGSTVVFKGKARFSPHFSLLANDSRIVFGDGFSCNNSCSFSSSGAGIEFGRDCLVGGDVHIRDSDGHPIWVIDENGERQERQVESSPVIIGDHVWLCTRSTVLKGVRIGSNSIVAFNALCTKSITESNCIIAGCPARVVKRGIEWEC